MNSVSASPKQYLVLFPSREQAEQGVLAGRLRQTQMEKNLSTPTRKVATLTPSEVQAIKGAVQGVEVIENKPLRVPTPEEMGWEPVEIAPLLKESIFTHGADKLHAKGIKGKSSAFAPIVVTVDTGIAAHKDLQTDTRGLKFYDVFEKREEAFNDVQKHGTHVTGIMAAGGELTGMAPAAEFIGVKCLNDQGQGTFASVLSGIEKAAEYYDQLCKESGRPMVVNLSLGGRAGPTKDDPIHKALPKLLESRPGLVICFAAGNNGPGANSVGTPGNFKHAQATTVAAADTKDTLPMDDDAVTRFSSRGGSDVAKGQDVLRAGGLMADGNQVLSTVNQNEYAKFSGTSMASPHTAGAAALLFDLAGKLHAEGNLKVKPQEVDVLSLLRRTARDNPAQDADTEGFGAIQVAQAADALIQAYAKNAGIDA